MDWLATLSPAFSILGPVGTAASTATAAYLSEQQRKQQLEDAARAQVLANTQALQAEAERQRQAALSAAREQVKYSQSSNQAMYAVLGLTAIAAAGYLVYRVVKKRR